MKETLTRSQGLAPLSLATPGLCIHELFELQARKTPEAPAVSCNDETLTYRQLNEQSGELADYLKSIRVGPEIPVALYLERSINMVVAILGVLKAGGAYVPIDP